MRRDLRQVSFADGLVNQRAGRNEWLGEIDRLIDWPAVHMLLEPIYGSDEGRPSYPVLTLVKLLLLQQWYGLSDPGLEEAVDDRLSFRRFAGLLLDEGVPDHSTVWRFRQNLAKAGLGEALFDEINRQLDARGLMIRRATLIDATIVKAAVAPPPAKEGTVSERDPEASWTTKNGKSTFGYKAHIAVDEGSNLIRGAILTGAEAAGYADKAYGSKVLREELAAAGIADPARRRSRLRNHEGVLRPPRGPIYGSCPARHGLT